MRLSAGFTSDPRRVPVCAGSSADARPELAGDACERELALRNSHCAAIASCAMTASMSVHPRILPSGFIEPCVPTAASVPPSGPGWLHEIKHDGYRLMARLEGRGVCLFSRRGHEWSGRFPRISEALASLTFLRHFQLENCACAAS